jgi:hypothetical protein
MNLYALASDPFVVERFSRRRAEWSGQIKRQVFLPTAEDVIVQTESGGRPTRKLENSPQIPRFSRHTCKILTFALTQLPSGVSPVTCRRCVTANIIPSATCQNLAVMTHTSKIIGFPGFHAKPQI